MPNWRPDPALARTHSTPELADGWEARLCAAFGLDTDRPPVAALARLGEDRQPDDDWWLHADPVCLAPAVDHLVLTPLRLQITPDEADMLVGEIKRFFADDDWWLEAATPDRWYLRLPKAPGIHTVPLRDAIGRDLASASPQGPDARTWRRYLTELQMLLTASSVNTAREARGEPAINCVWVWGEGRLPPAAPPRRWTRVWTNDVLARGLAAFTRTPISPAPTDARTWLAAAEAGEHLLVLTPTHHDSDKPPLAISPELERTWLAPLAAAVRTRALVAADGYAASGAGYDLGKTTRPAWRRLRALVRGWLAG